MLGRDFDQGSHEMEITRQYPIKISSVHRHLPCIAQGERGVISVNLSNISTLNFGMKHSSYQSNDDKFSRLKNFDVQLVVKSAKFQYLRLMGYRIIVDNSAPLQHSSPFSLSNLEQSSDWSIDDSGEWSAVGSGSGIFQIAEDEWMVNIDSILSQKTTSVQLLLQMNEKAAILEHFPIDFRLLLRSKFIQFETNFIRCVNDYQKPQNNEQFQHHHHNHHNQHHNHHSQEANQHYDVLLFTGPNITTSEYLIWKHIICDNFKLKMGIWDYERQRGISRDYLTGDLFFPTTDSLIPNQNDRNNEIDNNNYNNNNNNNNNLNSKLKIKKTASWIEDCEGGILLFPFNSPELQSLLEGDHMISHLLSDLQWKNSYFIHSPNDIYNQQNDDEILKSLPLSNSDLKPFIYSNRSSSSYFLKNRKISKQNVGPSIVCFNGNSTEAARKLFVSSQEIIRYQYPDFKAQSMTDRIISFSSPVYSQSQMTEKYIHAAHATARELADSLARRDPTHKYAVVAIDLPRVCFSYFN